MSNGLAIAGATALLKKVIEANLKAYNLEGPLAGEPAVKTTPPKDPIDADSQVHIFLYRAKENPSLRNCAYPSHSSGGERLDNPPLALDLYYCLTATGKADYHAEALLGASMQALHENATFSRNHVRQILEDVSLNELSLQDSLLSDQFERIRIIPHSVSEDEHFRILSSFQTAYRPSVLYQVSVVLITATQSTASGLPVLQPVFGSAPNLLSPYPILYSAAYLNKEYSALLGETVALSGLNLAGSEASIQLTHTLTQKVKTVAPTQVTESSIEFSLPDESDHIPAGDYEIVYSVKRDGETFARTTKLPAFKVGPTVVNLTSAPIEAGVYDIDLEFKPKLQPGQQLSLAIGSAQVQAVPIETATDTLSFKKQSIAVGSHLYRLYIDGVSSHFIDLSKTPPDFKADQVIVLA